MKEKIIILGLLVAILLSGCTTTKYHTPLIKFNDTGNDVKNCEICYEKIIDYWVNQGYSRDYVIQHTSFDCSNIVCDNGECLCND